MRPLVGVLQEGDVKARPANEDAARLARCLQVGSSPRDHVAPRLCTNHWRGESWHDVARVAIISPPQPVRSPCA